MRGGGGYTGAYLIDGGVWDVISAGYGKIGFIMLNGTDLVEPEKIRGH